MEDWKWKQYREQLARILGMLDAVAISMGTDARLTGSARGGGRLRRAARSVRSAIAAAERANQAVQAADNARTAAVQRRNPRRRRTGSGFWSDDPY